ncbi:MAG: TetR/AcrR family transcriptional regulator [Clostridiales bacterium]|nr:TetR/AcrR family transcriptional regulator [Clostridiales bacterium]
MNKAPEQSETADLRERILLAAIEEFGRMPYATASTNAIVQKAGVSKGLLFHYFGNKESLYHACVDYVFGQIWDYIKDRLDFPEADIFSRVRHSLRIKMEFYQAKPVLMELASKLWDSANRPDIEAYIRRLSGATPADLVSKPTENLTDVSIFILGKDVDQVALSDGIDIEKALDYMSILLNASWDRFTEKFGRDPFRISDNMGEYLAETDVILGIIQHGVYRNE